MCVYCIHKYIIMHWICLCIFCYFIFHLYAWWCVCVCDGILNPPVTAQRATHSEKNTHARLCVHTHTHMFVCLSQDYLRAEAYATHNHFLMPRYVYTHNPVKRDLWKLKRDLFKRGPIIDATHLGLRAEAYATHNHFLMSGYVYTHNHVKADIWREAYERQKETCWKGPGG